MKTWITTLSALALATTLSFAQDKPPGPPEGGPGGKGPRGGKRPNPEEIFKKLDANGDGSVSLDEFKAGPGPGGQPRDAAKAEEAFKKIDTDGNGNVSAEEFKAHRPSRGGGPGGDRPPGGPGGEGKGPGGKGPGGPGGKRPPADA